MGPLILGNLHLDIEVDIVMDIHEDIAMGHRIVQVHMLTGSDLSAQCFATSQTYTKVDLCFPDVEKLPNGDGPTPKAQNRSLRSCSTLQQLSSLK